MTKQSSIEDLSISLDLKNITYESYNLENTEIYITTFSSEKNDEDTAIVLSKLNLHIIKEFKPTVLTNESSEYFNKRLFPLINDFERKLRKLLYLLSAVNSSVVGAENIQNLEDLDLGKIFELLFTDIEFNKNAKSIINSKTWLYTQTEIVKSLKRLSENTLWDNLLGNKKINLLVENFISVKEIRNSVMHAHNISHEDYKAAKKLFDNINTQLDIEIGNIILKDKNEDENSNILPEFNNTLSKAFQYEKSLQALALSLSSLPKQQEIVSNLTPAFVALQEIVNSLKFDIPNLSAYSELANKISAQLPDLTHLDELTKNIAKQLPDITKYQEDLKPFPPESDDN